MEITKIGIIFENCEYGEIESKYIGTFIIDGIHPYISRRACNSISKGLPCKCIALEVCSKLKDQETNIFEERLFSGENIFNRILGGDITYIRIFYEDGTTEDIEVPWEDGDYQYNGWSKGYTNSKTNDFYLVIGEKEGIKDFFEYDDTCTFWDMFD